MSPIDRFLHQATIAAERLLCEIAQRYPKQARNYQGNVSMSEAWGRAIAESGVDLASLPWALAQLTARPYPPDVGPLLAKAEEYRLLDEQHARRLLRQARACCSTGQWHELPAHVWQAACETGTSRISDSRDEDLLSEWRRALRRAQEAPDDGCLTRQPRRPQARLPRSAEDDRRRATIAQAEIAKIRTLLGLQATAPI